MTTEQFSEYVVYVDESGDHGLENMDASYPMFVRAFCIFNKAEYVAHVVPVFQGLKFEYFGHDLVVLHEHEMRKQQGPFRILTNRIRRESFMASLNAIVSQAPFTVVAAAIDKAKLRASYPRPWNPYHAALLFCLERLRYHLGDQNAAAGSLHVVFESRAGAKMSSWNWSSAASASTHSSLGPIRSSPCSPAREATRQVCRSPI